LVLNLRILEITVVHLRNCNRVFYFSCLLGVIPWDICKFMYFRTCPVIAVILKKKKQQPSTQLLQNWSGKNKIESLILVSHVFFLKLLEWLKFFFLQLKDMLKTEFMIIVSAQRKQKYNFLKIKSSTTLINNLLLSGWYFKLESFNCLRAWETSLYGM